MTWLRVDIDFPGHESIGHLAEQLRIDPDRAGMTIIRLWCGFGQYRPDGKVAAITDTTLEDWAKWRGPRGKLAAAVREKLVDEDGRLKGWWRQEALLRHQEKKRDRRKTGTKPAPVSRPDSADNVYDNDNGTTSSQAGSESAGARLIDRVRGHPQRFALTEFLEQLPAGHDPDTWAGILLGCLDGMSLKAGRAASIEELASACVTYPGIRNVAWVPAQFYATVERTMTRMRETTTPALPRTGAQGADRLQASVAEFVAGGGK